MHASEGIRRSGIAIGPERTVHGAAAIMERSGIGALAVIENDRLVGIVTDRDLVRRGIARDVATDTRVDGVMSTPVITIEADADLHDAFALFRTHGLRRLAVVRDAQFIGMITIDDLLINLAGDLADLVRPITAETIFAHHNSPLPTGT